MRIQAVLVIVAGLLLIAVLGYRRFRTPPSSPPATSDGATLVDPKTLLFSLPTICDQLPPQGSSVTSLPAGAYYLHEDDWRQVEFVCVSDRPIIESEIEALCVFKEANRVGQFWKSTYVRKGRPNAVLSAHLSLPDVVRIVGTSSTQPLFIGPTSTSAPVLGGFVVPLSPTVALYGHQQEGVVVSLSIDNRGSAPYPEAPINALCRAFRLMVVDWYHSATHEPAPSPGPGA